MDLFIIDGNGPFFRDHPGRRVNWSKIPFEHLESGGWMSPVQQDQIVSDFDRLAARVSAIGFNAITLDDVAHLADSPRYPEQVRELVARYRALYRRLLEVARRSGLRVFINTDFMFAHRDAPHLGGPGLDRACGFFTELLEDLFAGLPDVAGVIARVGEADGLDVQGAFRSWLAIRTPGQARRFLCAILPVCERHRKLLVFRTWSVGAHRVGDLIWNPRTFRGIFGKLDSPQLVISMKYGESDFFRYLPLNPHFFDSEHAKLVELQGRREYEGCGEYPAFIGTDYERYRDALSKAPGLRGILVWCQTGGWTTFRRLTYLDNSSVWNEINTWVTLRLFRDGMTQQEAVESWCREHGRARATYDVLHLLRLSEEVVKALLYTDAFAERSLFFRRLRLPPLLSVYWDQVLVNYAMKRILRSFVVDGERQVEMGRSALRDIARMRDLAASAGLPVRDLEFMHDTFAILAAARRYYFRPYQPTVAEELKRMVENYRAAWPTHYAVHLDFERSRLPRPAWKLLFALLFRRARGYRVVDRLLTLRLLGWCYPLLRRTRSVIPRFAHQQAMGLETVFK